MPALNINLPYQGEGRQQEFLFTDNNLQSVTLSPGRGTAYGVGSSSPHLLQPATEKTNTGIGSA